MVLARRLVCGSVKMPIHFSFFYLSWATWMAANLALIMVCVSSWSEAST